MNELLCLCEGSDDVDLVHGWGSDVACVFCERVHLASSEVVMAGFPRCLPACRVEAGLQHVELAMDFAEAGMANLLGNAVARLERHAKVWMRHNTEAKPTREAGSA
ncbi:hypothetical protein STPYR_12777 [uncultured Stenotrophomonas sp.]|uniref:Uncharacterized protein n=1 Tax=uncultured Stenotrophomonas sp. TaxID=165438 RepID=A0A1Y5QCD5_9GAMM|nr:hypothetical protein STPYR_12777 [uncultured Stenotrophomonas sp.]